MDKPLFPDFMPQPLVDGYEEVYEDARYSFQNEVGAPIYRRKTTATAKTINVGYVISLAEKIKFEDWFNIETQQGTLAFDMSDPSNRELTQYTFVNTPTFNQVAPHLWQVNFQLRGVK